jgi:hypothetical protein
MDILFEFYPDPDNFSYFFLEKHACFNVPHSV